MGPRLIMSISPYPWTDEPDPVAPPRRGYRRIYNAQKESVARVYRAEDAKTIANAPQLLQLAYAIAKGEIITASTAAALYRKAGGTRPLDRAVGPSPGSDNGNR